MKTQKSVLAYFKHLALTLGLAAVMGMGVANANPTPAKMTVTSPQVGVTYQELLSGLINVNVGDITLNLKDVKVVDVNNVLNKNDINLLTLAIKNSPIASKNQVTLTNLLKNAKLLSGNKVVVGVVGKVLYVCDCI